MSIKNKIKISSAVTTVALGTIYGAWAIADFDHFKKVNGSLFTSTATQIENSETRTNDLLESKIKSLEKELAKKSESSSKKTKEYIDNMAEKNIVSQNNILNAIKTSNTEIKSTFEKSVKKVEERLEKKIENNVKKLEDKVYPTKTIDVKNENYGVKTISGMGRPFMTQFQKDGKMVSKIHSDIIEYVSKQGIPVAYEMDGKQYSKKQFFKPKNYMGLPALVMPDGRQLILHNGVRKIVDKDFIRIHENGKEKYLTVKSKVLENPNGDGVNIQLEKVLKIEQDGLVYNPRDFYESHMNRLLGSNRAPDNYGVVNVGEAVLNRQLREYKKDGTTVLRRDDTYFIWVAGALYLIQDAPFRFLDEDVHKGIKNYLDKDNTVGHTINDVVNIPFKMVHSLVSPLTTSEYDFLMGSRNLVGNACTAIAGKDCDGYTIIPEDGSKALVSGDVESVLQNSESTIGGGIRSAGKYWMIFGLSGSSKGGNGSSSYSNNKGNSSSGSASGGFTWGNEFGN